MKAEFKENETSISHVGLYRNNHTNMVVLFSDKNKCTGIVINSCLKNVHCTGSIFVDKLHPCTNQTYWEKLNTNEVTFKW